MLEVTDHVTTGTERLSYKLSHENVIKLLTILLEKAQELELEFVQLADQKSIDLAAGIYLDYIGKIVGVERSNLDDDSYREILKFQVSLNTSDGTHNVILSLIKEFTEADSVGLADSKIAFSTLSFNGQENTGSSVVDLLNKIRPAGTRFIVHSDFYDDSFLLAYESTLSSSEVFQTTEDGSTYENFDVTPDGVNYEPFFVVNESQGYYTPTVVEGRNNWSYEGETDSIMTLWWEVTDSSNPIIGIGTEDMNTFNSRYDLLSQEYTITVANIMVN